MKIIVLFTLCIGFAGLVQAQDASFKVNKLGEISSSTWTMLTDVKFASKAGFYYPTFGSKVKALSGKQVEVQGYIFPFDESKYSVHFALTSLPLSSCFFCGVGGAESVVEVEAKLPVKYTEKPVRMKGTLVLNDSDTEKMIYIIRDAVVLDE